ncbi:uracil-DNA glycosylase [Clostridium sp. 'deep sea']|uniref:uracil-DNA glycosylase n=1 Tax=Clostridium sp. 'deep sea' TaxID=2779445 RepID=UPI00189653D7|nr:uracil-DNA glycosylase [Clostridium sp. 'deep sea']QOR36274.1 uracil-DNA glycosylase [Clostridium sp. 'deep sea']
MLQWNELKQVCSSCTKCKLANSRKNLVFGEGNENAKLMFIGEAPGEQEDLQGIPFVGRSGQLLDKILKAVDLSRQDVYIANILKCRPPNNRDPLKEEKNMCINYLRNQVYLIKPKIIVCLGRVAAQTIINPSFKITQQHGKWVERKGYYLTAVYHPSALLRDPHKKRPTWEDFKEIKKKYDSL